MASADPTSHTVEYDANKNSVDSVTVFQTDRAEVKRIITVELQDGQNDVEVKNLPTCLEEDSIRVDGIGNATIFDVIYHPPPPYDHSKQKEALLELSARKDKVNADLKILQRQAEILSEYSKSLKASDTDSEKLETFLDVYGARQSKIDDAQTKLQEELAKIDKEIDEKRKTLDADEESIRKRGTRVTIIVHADGAGPAELSLTYVVSNAWWRPQYDLRASVAADSKEQSTVALHYRASISQKTGESWDSVKLTLSTASPLQGTKVPNLNPYWIGEKRTYYKTKSAFASRPPPAAPMSAALLSSGFQQEYEDTENAPSRSMLRRSATVVEGFGVGSSGPAPPGFFRSQDSEATAGAVSTVFAIPGLSTIPSDSDTAQQTHKVSIAELQFDSVDLEWISVPKEIPSVFLRCKVKNTSKYVLLAGQANVFLNNSFVAKSEIPYVSQQESFSCSLGVDPAIRITYHPRTTKTRTSGGSLLNTKSNITSSEQKITIKNTRLSRLPRLVVKDQIPVSRDQKIKVTLAEPKSLAGSSTQKGRGTVLQENVSVRWASWKADEDGGSLGASAEELDMESAQGMLEWLCSIEPGASVDLTLAWDVSAPSGVEWAKQ